MNPQNIKAAIILIKRYESITLEEIKATKPFINAYGDARMNTTANRLTGFGGSRSCTLCAPINQECSKCIYQTLYGCMHNKNTKTFDRIDTANTPVKLRNAFRARAKHIRLILTLDHVDTPYL